GVRRVSRNHQDRWVAVAVRRTGSEKRSLLNVVSSFVPKNDRIVTVEDASELKLPQDQVVTLEARSAEPRGRDAIMVRDLVKKSVGGSLAEVFEKIAETMRERPKVEGRMHRREHHDVATRNGNKSCFPARSATPLSS